MDQSTQDIQDLLKTHVDGQLKSFGAPSRQFTVSRSAAVAPNAQPYFVVINNATTVNLNGAIYFVQTTNPQTVLQENGLLPAQRQLGIPLGGPGECDILAAYRLIITDQNNNLVVDTGTVNGHQNPQNPCADIFNISQQ